MHAKDGSKAWTFKTGSEIKSSPVVTGDLVLIGSYDTHLYALDARTGKVRWKLKTDGAGARDAGGGQRDDLFRRAATNGSAPCAPTDGKVLFEVPLDANTGSSAVIEGTRAYLGTFNNEVRRDRSREAKKIAWRYQDPDRQFPFYSSPALAGGRVIIGGRDKAVHAIDAATRQGGVEVHHAGARGFLARGVGRTRVRRVERRQAVHARRADRERRRGNTRSATR